VADANEGTRNNKLNWAAYHLAKHIQNGAVANLDETTNSCHGRALWPALPKMAKSAACALDAW